MGAEAVVWCAWRGNATGAYPSLRSGGQERSRPPPVILRPGGPKNLLPVRTNGLRILPDDRVHGRACPGGNHGGAAGDRHLAEPVSGLRDHGRDPRVQRDLSEDRAAGLPAPEDPLRPGWAMPRAQVSQALHRGVSQPRDLLRERRQPDPGRLRRGLPPEENDRSRNVLIPGRNFIGRGSEVPEGVDVRSLRSSLVPSGRPSGRPPLGGGSSSSSREGQAPPLRREGHGREPAAPGGVPPESLRSEELALQFFLQRLSDPSRFAVADLFAVHGDERIGPEGGRGEEDLVGREELFDRDGTFFDRHALPAGGVGGRGARGGGGGGRGGG